jgi:hypothetical protein
MMFARFAELALIFTSLLLFGTNAKPISTAQETSVVAKRSVPSPPHWVIYSDEWFSGETGPPTVSQIAVRI